MIKIHFIFDKTKKSQKLKKVLLNKFSNFKPNKANVIVVAGGDGFMLRTLKKNLKFKKPFYGINCGTYGFLMNKSNIDKLEKRISKSKRTAIDSLSIKCIHGNRLKKNLIAFNEISIFRQSKQTALLNITVGKKEIIKKLIGDGVLVSTPAGSTAYNLSVHGPILSLNSKKISVSPISPFRPRRWRGKILSDKSKITIKNLDYKKRPISAVADNNEVRNIIKVDIKTNKKIKFNLLYDKNQSLQKKIKIEQLRKETN